MGGVGGGRRGGTGGGGGDAGRILVHCIGFVNVLV